MWLLVPLPTASHPGFVDTLSVAGELEKIVVLIAFRMEMNDMKYQLVNGSPSDIVSRNLELGRRRMILVFRPKRLAGTTFLDGNGLLLSLQ